jgi:tetratricopeptide (TPR) repeat protein
VLSKVLALHQKGQLAEAAALYGEIIARDPNNADALHLWGVIEGQRNDAWAALALIDRAIQPADRRRHKSQRRNLWRRTIRAATIIPRSEQQTCDHLRPPLTLSDTGLHDVEWTILEACMRPVPMASASR